MSATATIAPDDRRASLRRQPAVGVTSRVLMGDTSVLGLVWNISSGGLSMLVSRRFDVEDVLNVVLIDTTELVQLPARLRVTHQKTLLTGDFVLGGQFETPLTEEQLRPFLG